MQILTCPSNNQLNKCLTTQKQSKMRQKLSKWYAVPPYRKGENWKILNDKGEIVAWFEEREDCEKAVEVYNEYVAYENEKKQ